MRRTILALCCTLLLSASARAGMDVPPAVIDTSQFATQSQMSSAIAAATPNPCSTPAADTLTGAAGTGTPCMSRPDSARPTAIQRANAYTDASGNWSVTWSRAGTTLDIISAEPVVASGTFADCSVNSVTATAASGQCRLVNQGSQTPLSISIVTAGLTIDTRQLNTAPPSGTRVMVKNGGPTQ